MKFVAGSIPGVVLIEPKLFGDARGWFLEFFHQKKFQEGGIDVAFVQDNHSKSGKGILRGLHAQLNHPQGKLLRVTVGEVYDVAVDIRKGSPTFGQWMGVNLSAENHKMIYIPPGFAHGFCVISEEAEVQYKCTDFYDPTDEITLLWNDPAIGVEWPETEPLLSEKDKNGKPLSEIEKLLI